MSFKSAPDQYGRVAVAIHWFSALLMVALIGSGFRAAEMEDAAAKAAVLRVHIPIGVTILLLTLTRLGWWLFVDNKPASVPMPSWQHVASRVVHILFYVLILGTAASGIGTMILSGAGPIIFGGELVTTLPDFFDYPPRRPHEIGAGAIVALLVLHAGAVLYHQLFKQDQLLQRMWFEERQR
ncbi:cytochrome b [Microbulbifer discodermiae]|uniref:cytochrome b n=1 Tax=Microbulbifer sp. 2201CG32-9 TaxID=3232309 RepID=UPI00345BA43F